MPINNPRLNPSISDSIPCRNSPIPSGSARQHTQQRFTLNCFRNSFSTHHHPDRASRISAAAPSFTEITSCWTSFPSCINSTCQHQNMATVKERQLAERKDTSDLFYKKMLGRFLSFQHQFAACVSQTENCRVILWQELCVMESLDNKLLSWLIFIFSRLQSDTYYSP